MIFLPCKLAFCFHYRCLLFAQSGSVNKVHLPWYIFTIAQAWHHFSQAHSQLHCHCPVLQKLGSQPQWEFKSAWYLARCDSTIVLQTKAIRRFVFTEKAPTRAFSWLKAATTTFTFNTLLRHYAKRLLTPRSLNVKLGPWHNYHKGWAVWLA